MFISVQTGAITDTIGSAPISDFIDGKLFGHTQTTEAVSQIAANVPKVLKGLATKFISDAFQVANSKGW